MTIEKSEEQALSGSSLAAEERAAELVGMKQLEDGTFVENPDAHWAISDTTREDLRKLVEKAFKEGWTPEKLRDEIMQATTFSAERAMKIANTEITQAQAEGNMLMWKATGSVTKVRWSLSANHECCDVCDKFAKLGPVPLGHEFAPGITKPGAHPFCECALIVVSLKAA